MDRWPATSRAAAALSAAELAAVVRRASELDAALPALESDLDVDEARAVLREAGVSSPAAEQALAEWGRGELAVAPPPPLPEPGRRMPSMVGVERLVPLPADAVRSALDAQLRRQCFTRGRSFGAAGAEWLPRTGLYADLRRRLDVRGTLLLQDVSRTRLTVRPGKPGTCQVSLSADLGALRSRLLSGMVIAPAAAGAAATLIGIPVESLELVASGLPVGLVLAGGGYLSAGRTLERRRVRVEESLHILLDRVSGARY